uniref:Gpt n=1 Tax=Arundo donax TaxID=35708 RepID=A0A0A9DHQ8_ARUDO
MSNLCSKDVNQSNKYLQDSGNGDSHVAHQSC